MDAPIARNYVNWTLPRAERDSFLCYVERARGCQAAKEGMRAKSGGTRAKGRDLMDETECETESMDGTRKSVHAVVPLGRIEVLPFATVTPGTPCIDSSFKLRISGRTNARALARPPARPRVHHQTSNAIEAVSRIRNERLCTSLGWILSRARDVQDGGRDSITRRKNIPRDPRARSF